MPLALESSPDNIHSAEIEFAHRIADEARVIALKYYRHWHGLQMKSDHSPVTLADREIEQLVRAGIEAGFPGDGVFGEETGITGGNRDRLWIIDPIDGTGAFATGNPLFGLLLGFCVAGQPVVGMLDAPVMGERWIAVRGQGATMNGTPCRTSGRTRLEEAAISCTAFHAYGPKERASFQAVSDRAALTRLGGDCYAFGLVALGHLDAVVECELQPYDYLPLVPIIEEAGGRMTDWQGNRLTTSSEGRVVAAASAELHEQIMGVL